MFLSFACDLSIASDLNLMISLVALYVYKTDFCRLLKVTYIILAKTNLLMKSAVVSVTHTFKLNKTDSPLTTGQNH